MSRTFWGVCWSAPVLPSHRECPQKSFTDVGSDPHLTFPSEPAMAKADFSAPELVCVIIICVFPAFGVCSQSKAPGLAQHPELQPPPGGCCPPLGAPTCTGRPWWLQVPKQQHPGAPNQRFVDFNGQGSSDQCSLLLLGSQKQLLAFMARDLGKHQERISSTVNSDVQVS